MRELGAHGVMVTLDNHVSQPKWCCNYDGNGFFGDSQFRHEEWLQGLVTVAKLFKWKIQVQIQNYSTHNFEFEK